MVPFSANHPKAVFWQLGNANRGPCYKPGKDRDCEGELNDAESASKASVACMKKVGPYSATVTWSHCQRACRLQYLPWDSEEMEFSKVGGTGVSCTEHAAAGCSAASHSTLRTVPASSVVSQHLLCSSSLQMPYLLLNPSMPEMRPRMYPVFFGESIEVTPEPMQEIRYRWGCVGSWDFCLFPGAFPSAKN